MLTSELFWVPRLSDGRPLGALVSLRQTDDPVTSEEAQGFLHDLVFEAASEEKDLADVVGMHPELSDLLTWCSPEQLPGAVLQTDGSREYLRQIDFPRSQVESLTPKQVSEMVGPKLSFAEWVENFTALM